MALFFAGDSESADTIIVALELPNNDWFKRALVEALTLMCDQNNWRERGTATADFARDKACEMNETMEFDVHIPVIPIGTIWMHAGVTVPPLWKRCEGNSLLRSAYPDLFAAIGTIYGAADGTHFNLPDFRDRSPIGWNAAATNQGIPAGAMTHAISTAELPAHNHGITDPGHTHGINTRTAGTAGSNNVIVAGTANIAEAPVVKASNSNTTGISTTNTGSGNAMSLLHPVLPLQVIIYAGV